MPVLVSSGDLIVDRRCLWALNQAARGDLHAAIDVLVQALDLAPCFAGAWFALGTIRERLGDREGAVQAFTRACECDPEDYHGARLHLARLQAGQATPAMTAVYVRRLFDEHAASFDRMLIEHLNYRGPALLREAVAEVCRAAGRPMRFAAALDLGCGTGLAGAAFRDCADRMCGVDLSPRMIERARAKGIYDRLEVGDLLQGLAAEEALDLVLAADVFVYVPDLAPVAAAVARRLAPGGLFAFTVETHDGDGVLLGASLRYAHGGPHVREALAGAGLAIDHFVADWCRTERGLPVDGLLVVARRV